MQKGFVCDDHLVRRRASKSPIRIMSGLNKKSSPSSTNNTRGVASPSNNGGQQQPRQDYEYFQLYDPDESDLDEELDPDVRRLLENSSSYPYSQAKRTVRLCSNCCRYELWIEVHAKHIVILVATILLLVIILAVGFGVSSSHGQSEIIEVQKVTPSWSTLGNYSRAAVAADGGEPCAKIGVEVLKRNGTAVDAAVATLFCNGVYSSHSMGIGGGFLMTIFHKASGQVKTIDARETAPGAATVDMFHSNGEKSATGGLAVGVPGELRGYWVAKQKYGNPNVSWSSLVKPTIQMCKEGIPVSFSHAGALNSSKEKIFRDPGMKEIFINPATNNTWKEGDTYKRLNLGQTLEAIAKNGSDEFYSGQTAQKLVDDLTRLGGIITLQDLNEYEVKIENPVMVDLTQGQRLYSIRPPGSGILLAYIINIMEQYKLQPADVNDPIFYHRLVESFKWAYAFRTKLGDPFDYRITDEVLAICSNLTSEATARATYAKINDTFTVNNPKYYGADYALPPADHGTSHTSVLAPNGDAVAVTSTVNLYFGAKIMSPSTGIIYNDQMDDFSSPNITNEFGVPPSEHNFIRPGKRPMSSMCPAIILDKDNNARIITGAAGGTRITTATAFAILHNLWLGYNIKESIDERRIHHQLVPMRVDHEPGFSNKTLQVLMSKGHIINEVDTSDSIVTGITRESDGRIYANSDFRKAGGVDGF